MAAAALANSVQVFIAAKMTAVLQLTDTDFAMSFKAALTRAKQSLLDDLQVGNAQMRHQLSFPCEPYHILRCLKEAQDYMIQKNAEKENLLAGLRRNGFLSYRPDFATGLLRRTDDAEWAKCFSEGSQMIPEQWI